MQVDASKSGLGATLFQNNHPVSMASKALNTTQENYAVIEKEMLAICFGCKKFHEYIFGRHVTVETDHKPLVHIMTKPMHSLTARMQRMRMRLQNYDITLKYTKGTDMHFADTLSRAHTMKILPNNLFDDTISVAAISHMDADVERIIRETKKDETLQEVIAYTRNGWPVTQDAMREDVKPYYTFREEFSIYQSMLMKGD